MSDQDINLQKRSKEIINLLKVIPKEAIWAYFPRNWSDWVNPGTPYSEVDMLVRTGNPKDFDVDMAYCCFSGQTFIESLWRRPNLNGPWVAGNITEDTDVYIKDIPKPALMTLIELSHKRGVYSCQISHTVEDHGFIMYITNKRVIIYNTYAADNGGYFYVKIQNRIDWFNDIKLFFKLSADSQFYLYPRLFGIDPETTQFLRDRMIGDGKRMEFELLRVSKIY